VPKLHQNTVKSGNTKFYKYPHEPECKRQWILPGTRHDWAPTEHAKIIFSKNCPHITAVKVVVGVQLFQDCSWRRKKKHPKIRTWQHATSSGHPWT